MLFCEVCAHEGTEQLRYTKEIYVRKDGLKQMLAIKKIYMDYETAPVGVSHMPQFAWELVSNKKNVKQKSYELQIAKDADFTDLIYNSGKTESEESAHVYAEGASLESGKRYFVRAKASDGQEETDCSETASFVTALAGKNGEWEEGSPAWKAPFVSAETDDSYKSVSKGTYVRGTFEIKKDIKEAYAFTTALGLYQFYLNGKKVGEDEMTPGWTSYRRHLLYQTYDVTEYLQKGINGAGAMLAPGWYKGVMGLTKARNNYGDQTAFTMELLIRYTDGTTESVYTDPSWKGCDSPVVFAEIYDGETYDAALEIPDWSKAETTKGDWKPVQLVFFDTQVMRAQYAAKVRVMDRIPAKRIFKTPAGDRVVDFAQNMAGRIEVTATGKPVSSNAWKGRRINCILINADRYTVKSALYTLDLCGKNSISDINGVLWVCTYKDAFYIEKIFAKTVSFFRRWIYFHSCYGVKGRYFTLFQVGTEGGELLWRNLLPSRS